MADQDESKKYGIRGALPAGDPMRGEHLLGDDWQWERWYASAQERDQALLDMTRKHPYYRVGDHPTQSLSKVQR